MKKLSVILAIVLAISMILTACGASNTTGSAASTPTAAAASSAAPEAAKGEPYTIKYAFCTNGDVPDLTLVQNEMSKKLLEKINATVEFLPLSWAAFTQQVNLMIAGGEKLDLVTEFGSYLTGDVAKNRLNSLDDLLDKNGPDIKSNLGNYLKAGQINGVTYSTPCIRNMGNAFGLTMRKDLVDKYGIDVSQIKNYADAEAVFKIIKEKEPGMYPTMSQLGSVSVYDQGFAHFDALSDEFGVLMDITSTKVVDKYEDPAYKEDLKLIRKWYQAGYIPKDLPTMTDGATSLVKSGKLFSFFSNIKPGFEQQATNQSGTRMVSVQLVEPYAVSSAVAAFGLGIPVTCKDADSTMKFMNLLYSDPEIINLIDWGIEGTHYVKADDGTITYPEGVDAKTNKYPMNLGFQFGNQLLSNIFKGDSPDLWKNLKAFNDSAVLSAAFGFNFDSSSLKAEYAALTNVYNQYKIALEDGALDPDIALPKYISALKDAGLEKYMAEKQRQLDAWLATQK